MDFIIRIGNGFGFLSSDILLINSIYLEDAIESISNDYRNQDRWWGSNETLRRNTKIWLERAKPTSQQNPEPHIAFPRCYCVDDAEQTIFRILNEAILRMTEKVCDSILTNRGGDYRPLFSRSDVLALKKVLGKRIETYVNIRTNPEHSIRIIVRQLCDRLHKLPIDDNTKSLKALVTIASILGVESEAVKSARKLLSSKE